MWDLTADVIFGHLCWQIRYDMWKEELEQFLEDMTVSPIFTISDVLPEGYLPRPITKFDGDSRDADKDDIDTNKQYKKIRYISIKSLKTIYQNKNIWDKADVWKIKEKIENNKKYSDIWEFSCNKNIIDRKTGTTWDNWIYSQSENFLKDGYSKFSFFIKILDEEKLKQYNVLKNIKQIFEIWIWAKKSTWKWVFTITKDRTEKDNFERENGQNFLLLSNFIPAQDDATDGAYTTYTKFGKLGEDKSMSWLNFHKKPVIFLEKWACFVKNEKWYMGRMIEDIAVEQGWIWQYGYGCVLCF